MPAILTHYFFSKKIQVQSPQEIQTILDKHSDIYSLGSQGPDIFYFNILNKRMVSLGGKIHKNGVNLFLKACIQYVDRASENEKDILFSYLAGFLSHYMLDAFTHPYIFYKSGFSDESGALGGVFSQQHHHFETNLDSLLCKKYTGKSPAHVKLWKKMRCAKDKRNIVANMYKYSIRAAYGDRFLKRSYVKSMDRFCGFYKCFNDKRGVKKKLVSKIENMFRVPGYISSMIHFSDAADTRKYLNLNKEAWMLPWDKDSVSNKSFLEIMDDSRIKCLDSVKFLYDAVYKGGDVPILLYILGDLSFVTGLDCTKKVEFIYMENSDL